MTHDRFRHADKLWRAELALLFDDPEAAALTTAAMGYGGQHLRYLFDKRDHAWHNWQRALAGET